MIENPRLPQPTLAAMIVVHLASFIVQQTVVISDRAPNNILEIWWAVTEAWRFEVLNFPVVCDITSVRSSESHWGRSTSNCQISPLFATSQVFDLLKGSLLQIVISLVAHQISVIFSYFHCATIWSNKWKSNGTVVFLETFGTHLKSLCRGNQLCD